MAHWKTLFRGDYIAAVEFGEKKPTLTIREVKMCKLEQDDGRQKDKGVIFFKETDRGWVFCKTNAMCLAAMFGDDVAAWLGKRVTLFTMMVQVGPSQEPGIRVQGSPDLEKPLSVSIKLPRKKAFSMRLTPTPTRANGAASAAPRPSEDTPPPSDDEPGHDDAEVSGFQG